MIYQDNSITSQGEQAFIQALYDYLLSLDDRITCDTTVAAQYALTTGKPTFNFSFDGKPLLTLQREDDITSSSAYYYIHYMVNGSAVASSHDFNTNITIASIKSFIGENACLLFFHLTSSEIYQPFEFDFSVGCISDGEDYYGGGIDSLDLLGAQFYQLENYTSGYYFAKMINFAAPAGNIGYSSIAPFSNGGSLAFYVSEVLSCSTVQQFITINLPDGKNYISISCNAMVELTT